MPCFSIKICLVSKCWYRFWIFFFFLLVHPLFFEPKAGLYIAAWKFCTDPEWIFCCCWTESESVWPLFRCRFPERDLKLLQLLRVQCAWITRSYEVLSEHIVPNVQTGRQDEEPAVVSKVVGLRRFQTLFTIQQEPGLKHTDPLNR